jgi:hypothetical protein
MFMYMSWIYDQKRFQGHCNCKLVYSKKTCNYKKKYTHVHVVQIAIAIDFVNVIITLHMYMYVYQGVPRAGFPQNICRCGCGKNSREHVYYVRAEKFFWNVFDLRSGINLVFSTHAFHPKLEKNIILKFS